MGLLDKVELNTQTATPSVTTAASTTTASTVTNPLFVKDVKKDENMGLTVEKTTQKTGESIDERLNRFYTKYKDATPEEKEKFLDKYITQYYSEIKGKSRSEQIQIQLADYKKLIANTKKGDSYEMLAKRINILEKENQISAAKNLTVEQKDLELRRRGEIGISKTIHNCDKGNQVELTKLVVDSKNEEAIKIGALNASKLAVETQKTAVKIYANAYADKDGNVDKKYVKTQNEINKALIDQYAKFAKENQVEIHKTMSSSKLSETVEYAAANIYQLDKSNQAEALQITKDTGNEEAAKKAEEGIKQAEEKEKAKEAQEAKEAKDAKDAEAKEKTASESKETSKKDIRTQIQEIEKSNSINKTAEIEIIFKKASPAQILTILEQNPSMAAIKAALENPSSEVLSKIISLTGDMADKDQREIMEKINGAYSFNVIASKMNLFSAKTQNIFIKEFADKGHLKSINKMFLLPIAKDTYDKMTKTTKTA